MRRHTLVPATILSLGMLVSVGCADQSAQITAPEASALQAPAEPSFQRQDVDTDQANFGNLIAALNNITVNINQLEALNDLIDTGDISIEDINIALVNVDDVTVSLVALNNALNRNETDIDALQDFLQDVDITITEVLTNVLTNADIDVEDVVAVDVNLGTLDITIFFDQ